MKPRLSIICALVASVEDLKTGAYNLKVYRIHPAVRGVVYP